MGLAMHLFCHQPANLLLLRAPIAEKSLSGTESF
uniref:Uncharacterized protein n=1 Tax=Rhizophora mucronata TaxID=61149 RepID=A0A2P2PHS5_RHIMU